MFRFDPVCFPVLPAVNLVPDGALRGLVRGIKSKAIGSSTVNDQHLNKTFKQEKGVYDEKYYPMA